MNAWEQAWLTPAHNTIAKEYNMAVYLQTDASIMPEEITRKGVVTTKRHVITWNMNIRVRIEYVKEMERWIRPLVNNITGADHYLKNTTSEHTETTSNSEEPLMIFEYGSFIITLVKFLGLNRIIFLYNF